MHQGEIAALVVGVLLMSVMAAVYILAGKGNEEPPRTWFVQ